MKAGFVILLVEDEPDDAELIQAAFRRCRLRNRIMVTTDGEQALDYLKGHRPYHDRSKHPMPELVLLDVKLPGQSGLEVLRAIRKEPRLCRLPIVLLSSSDVERDVNDGYESGANAYFCKPTSMERLEEIVKTIVEYWSASLSPTGVR